MCNGLLGALIPFRVLKWPIIGVGALSVVVMASYTFVILGKRLSGYFRLMLKRARGHVRHDPQLGTLIRDTNGHCWVATLTRSERTVDFVTAGDDDPSRPLLAYAHDLLARFDAVERRAEEYLVHEAAHEIDPSMAAEILALHISSVHLCLPDRPGHARIDFEGPDEMRYWYCDYTKGELSHLGFDT